jgi:hypothetical protein
LRYDGTVLALFVVVSGPFAYGISYWPCEFFKGTDLLFSLSLGYKCDWTSTDGYLEADASAMADLIRRYEVDTSSAGNIDCGPYLENYSSFSILVAGAEQV